MRQPCTVSRIERTRELYGDPQDILERQRAAQQPMRERFALEPTTAEGTLTFFVEHGEEFVPRLFADPDITIRSVHVARPTLDDVFMTYTGRTIRDAEASGAERNRSNPWVRSSRR